MQYTTDYGQLHDEQALITLIVGLENAIERAEGAKAKSGDAKLNATLRQLRRQRARYLSALLDEVQLEEYSLNAA